MPTCKNAKCTIAETGHCFLNADPVTDCIEYKSSSEIPSGKKAVAKKNGAHSFWSGDALKSTGIAQLSKSNIPLIIGILGTAKASKTSYLGMVFTLLFNGHFLKNYLFAGSSTMMDWERLYFAMRFHKGKVFFPEATPSNPGFYRLYHLRLKKSPNQLKDILFADASGEVFSQWALNVDDENADSARWIYANSNAFILHIDCLALIEKRGEAKENILDIAHRAKQGLGDRPVAIVWAKADLIGDVRPQIKASLTEELQAIFNGRAKEFEVSNFSFGDPDLKCHENNLAVLNWFLEDFEKQSGLDLKLEVNSYPNDLFINYKN